MTPSPAARHGRRSTDPILPTIRQVLAILGISTAGSIATLVLAAANWISLPDQVHKNTDAISELREGQDFMLCVARAQVRHIDPAACTGLDPVERSRGGDRPR